jgi:PAS domain S-box-containing protein
MGTKPNPPFPREDSFRIEGRGHAIEADGPAPGWKEPETPVPTPGEEWFRSLVKNSSDVIAILNPDSTFRYVTPSMEQVLGHRPLDVIGRNSLDYIHPDDLPMMRKGFQRSLQKPGVSRTPEFRFRHANGSWVYLESIVNNLLDDPGVRGLIINSRDITERKHGEQLQSALYRIAEKASSAGDLLELYAFIHSILGELMFAKNCFIALYDPENNSIHFPYWVDEKDPAPKPTGHRSRKFGKGLTEYILRTGQPLLLTADQLKELITRGEAELIGAFSTDWMGVPLKKGDHTFGALVLQTYELIRQYGEREKEILVFVSQQVANAIEQRRNQEAIRESESKYRSIFENAAEGIFQTTLDGQWLTANPSLARTLGYDSPEDLMRHLDLSRLYVQPGRRKYFAELLSKKDAVTELESDVYRKDGQIISISENLRAVRDASGQLTGLVGTLQEITARKRAEEALMESESKFRGVADTASSAILIHDGEKFVYVNHAAETITGYSRRELLYSNILKLIHPDFQEETRRRTAARLRGEPAPSRIELKIVTKDGQERWGDVSTSTIQFGGHTAVLSVAVDITERKRAEQLQSALYRIADKANTTDDLPTLYQAIHGIVGELMYAKNFYIALYDTATAQLTFPYAVDEADTFSETPVPMGRGLTEYVFRTGHPLLATPQVFDGLVSHGEVELVGANSVDWLGVPLKTGSTTFGVLVVQSYTEDVRFGEREEEILTFVSQHVANAIERKRSQEALRHSEQRYRSLVQSAVYGIYRSSLEDRFVAVNPALVAMLGYDSEDQLLGLKLSRDVYAEPGVRDRLIQQYRSTGRVESVEVKWKRKDGKIITVRLSGAVLNPSGDTEGFEMIAEDVTERRVLEEQFRQSQKMEAVGRLAGGVAHDFNNLLTVIQGYTDLMLDQFGKADPLRAEMEEVQKAAERAVSLTRQLLAFSRQQMMVARVLDLNSVVTNMEKLLRRLLGEDVELTTTLEPALGRVTADPSQVEQVIMNLAVNARDAMPRGGKLTIETASAELDDTFAREHPSLKGGPCILLAVSDTGAGMDAETQSRIFEPFFTTKELGKGTGLGLSTVYGIVKQSGGDILVYSEIGVGTTFKVYLPRADQAAEAPHVSPALTEQGRGTETVLLVEDEDGVRALARKVLHKGGYTVLEARNGGEALLTCERHPGPIELLLTDVVLAQMSGHELAQRLLPLRPGMRVLYMSGYTDEAVVRHGVLSAGTAFLQKPFSAEALTTKVRQVLDTWA